jgi:hypothetical protein
MRATKLTIQSDRELAELLNDMRTARIARSAAIRRVDALNNDLLLRMSAAGAQVVEDSVLGRFGAYRAGGGMDWRGYAESLESLVPSAADRSKFKRESTTWAIRVPRGFTGDDE